MWTAAGVSAGIDLALALVEDDHGTEVAQTVARWLVLYLRRPGGQTQFAAPVWVARAKREPIRAVQEAIESEPGGAHSITDLARLAAMSPRHFTRVFTDEVGEAPGAYVERVRTEAARRQLEQTDDTVRDHRRPLRLRHRGNHAPQLHSPCRRIARPIPKDIRMTQIAIVVYPGFTALDFIGPYEVLRWLPDTEVRFVWHEPGPITADSGVPRHRGHPLVRRNSLARRHFGAGRDDHRRARPRREAAGLGAHGASERDLDGVGVLGFDHPGGRRLARRQTRHLALGGCPC